MRRVMTRTALATITLFTTGVATATAVAQQPAMTPAPRIVAPRSAAPRTARGTTRARSWADATLGKLTVRQKAAQLVWPWILGDYVPEGSTEWARLMQEVIPGGRPNYDELLNPQTPEAKARSTKLEQTYKLTPAMMKKVDDTYGPLEWRLPETHAIYWGMMGIEHSPAQDKMPLRREIFQPMLTAFQRGRIVTNRFARRVEIEPNLDIIPNVSRAYEDSIAAEPANADHIGTAHRNFMKDAIYFLYAKTGWPRRSSGSTTCERNTAAAIRWASRRGAPWRSMPSRRSPKTSTRLRVTG